MQNDMKYTITDVTERQNILHLLHPHLGGIALRLSFIFIGMYTSKCMNMCRVCVFHLSSSIILIHCDDVDDVNRLKIALFRLQA